MNDDTKDTLEQVFKQAHDSEYSICKDRQKQKLSKLMEKENGEPTVDLSGTQLKKWVINLSKREQSRAETTGQNFALSQDN